MHFNNVHDTFWNFLCVLYTLKHGITQKGGFSGHAQQMYVVCSLLQSPFPFFLHWEGKKQQNWKREKNIYQGQSIKLGHYGLRHMSYVPHNKPLFPSKYYSPMPKWMQHKCMLHIFHVLVPITYPNYGENVKMTGINIVCMVWVINWLLFILMSFSLLPPKSWMFSVLQQFKHCGV